MNLLLICEIAQGLPTPDFGEALTVHINKKKHPEVQSASRTVWNLLAYGLKQLGYEALPTVEFETGGKPYFTNCGLHFSLTHSAGLAAALISPAPCAVDVECIRPETEKRLYKRCLSNSEQASGCDFFEAWTKKECIGKLSGAGMPGHPCKLDILNSPYAGYFFLEKVHDFSGQEYALCALCTNGIAPGIQKIKPEELL